MHFLKYIKACKASLAWAKSDDEEWSLSWYWNKNMYELRILLEMVEGYLGGRSFYEFHHGGAFLRILDEGGCINGRVKPLPEDMRVICKAWHEDDLYGCVLAGDPGVLADVRPDAVEWFTLLVDDAVNRGHIPLRADRELNRRGISWKGYTDPDATWLDD